MKTIFFILLFVSAQVLASEIYRQACHVIGEDDYVQNTIEITNALTFQTDFNLKLTVFEDENCQTPYLQYNQYFQVADFKNGLLDLRTKKITYTALSEEVANALNLIHYCDLKNWKSGKEQAVTGKVCETYEQLAEEQTLFQILNWTDSGLKFGNISSKENGRSEKARPTFYDAVDFIK